MHGVLSAELQTQLNSGRQLLAERRDALTRFGASEAVRERITDVRTILGSLRDRADSFRDRLAA